MKKISIILPSYEKDSATKVGEWILSLPELKIMSEFDVEAVQWNKEVTGDDKDWFAMAKAITTKWNESDGFIVWAPEQSVLELSGVLDLLFRDMGKPIVVFSADSPHSMNNNKIALYGLKSVLINSMYIAMSDIAQVIVLSGSKLFKPEGCYWGSNDYNMAAINSVYEQLGIIDFSLKMNVDYKQRENVYLPESLPNSLEKKVFIPHWSPSLLQDPVWPAEKPKAIILSTDINHWDHPGFKKIRERALQDQVTAIWYSKQNWPDQDLEKSEVSISHPNFWWAVLATQFSLAKHSSASKALKMLKGII